MRIENKASARGIGFFGLLQVAFIVLKLCHVIDWSWLWVLAPIWGPIGLFIIGSAIFIIYAIIAGKVEERQNLKKEKKDS